MRNRDPEPDRLVDHVVLGLGIFCFVVGAAMEESGDYPIPMVAGIGLLTIFFWVQFMILIGGRK